MVCGGGASWAGAIPSHLGLRDPIFVSPCLRGGGWLPMFVYITAFLCPRAPGRLHHSSWLGAGTGAESPVRWGGEAPAQGSGLTPMRLYPEGSGTLAFWRAWPEPC